MLFGAAVVPMAMNGDTTVVAAKRVDINVPDEHGPKTVECMKSTFVICAEKGGRRDGRKPLEYRRS